MSNTLPELDDGRILDGRAGIFEFELLAVALEARIEVFRYPGRPVLIWRGNQDGIGSSIRGFSVTELGRVLSSAIWRISAEPNNQIWIELVPPPSGVHVADAPTRFCTENHPYNEFTHHMGNSPYPTCFAHALSSADTLRGTGIKPATNQTWRGRPVRTSGEIWVPFLAPVLYGIWGSRILNFIFFLFVCYKRT